MPDDQAGLVDSIARVPERVAAALELLTTLDQRIITALDSLEEMRTSIAGFDDVGRSGDDLVRDIQERIARFDERMNRDLDELKAELLAKLGELDVTDLGARIEKLERSIENVERATVNLDRNVEGALEALPDFMTKRIKGS